MRPVNKEVRAMWDSIRACDDRLGAYSDHEGGTGGGPVEHFWLQGRTAFSAQAARAIRDHEMAIDAWKEAEKLNQRLPSSAPAVNESP